MDSIARTPMAIEREMDDARSIQDAGASDKRKESRLSSSSSGKNRGLLLCEGFGDRVVATRAKARISHPKMGDTSRLLASQGREFVPVPPAWTFETGLPLEERVLEL